MSVAIFAGGVGKAMGGFARSLVILRGAHDARDPFLESPLGRFILQFKLDRLCFDNALNFVQLVRRVYAAKGVPQPVPARKRYPHDAGVLPI
jgi:hypothetical protein